MKFYSFLFLAYKGNKSAFVMSLIILAQTFFISGCNFNLLGGKNSEISSGYTPGLRTESLPPTISPISDVEMDENDIVQLPFQISDPDTFLFCSNINVGARSSDNAVIQSANMTVTGTYPNCILNVRSSSVTASKQVDITVDVFDFWTYVSTSFKLTVRRVEKPGPFRITKNEGFRQSIIVHWSEADYMDGSSARYYLYYKKVDDQSLLPSSYTAIAPVYQASPAASQTLFTEVRNATNPYWISSPNNTLDDSTLYEVYVTARNGFNNKNPGVPLEESNHVFVRTLDRYQFLVREFVSSSQQAFIASATVHTPTCAGGSSGTIPLSPVAVGCVDSDRFFTQASLGSPMQGTIVPTASGRYRVYLNAQGLMYGEYP
ncbi:hypothetical protein CIK05_14250 [Bdellovibrio sp. qaytius]|nr:hypothetical protein CIK05_14250 [Bdellovibrio sp. qaytius]